MNSISKAAEKQTGVSLRTVKLYATMEELYGVRGRYYYY